MFKNSMRFNSRTPGSYPWSGPGIAVCLVVCGLLALLSPAVVSAQDPKPSEPVVVQPGAPGKPTKVLPSTTRAKLPPVSAADISFMQGMITHHEQAVEMTALIDSRTENREVRSLGARISHSQADEIQFMKRWLVSRGQQLPTDHSHHAHMSHGAMMPGMLSAEQMETLRKAKGEEFDILFLKGMIQHHDGALIMVRDLFGAAGSRQDAELFNFATDVDSGQRAEIRVMQKMVEKITSGEKR